MIRGSGASWSKIGCVGILIVIAALMGARTASAGQRPLSEVVNPGGTTSPSTPAAVLGPENNNAGDAHIFPIESHPFGRSYGEWSVAYWKWAMGIPYAQNPWANDATGAFSDVGQSGPVWFLGGTLGSSVERTLTVPRGKAIFMPVQQWLFGATVGDCDPTNPGVTCDVPALQAAAAGNTLAATILEVSIDGDQVRHERDYRAASPGAFSLTLPDGSVSQAFFGIPPAGTYAPQVSDGYWLMLAPLGSGRHVIRVHVANPNSGEFFVVYNITVPGRGRFGDDNLSTGEGEAVPTNAVPGVRHTSWGRVKAFYH